MVQQWFFSYFEANFGTFYFFSTSDCLLLKGKFSTFSNFFSYSSPALIMEIGELPALVNKSYFCCQCCELPLNS